MRSVIVVVFLVGLASARVTFPARVWAEPGSDLEVVCKSTRGTVIRVYSPQETVPNDTEMMEFRKVMKSFGQSFGEFNVQSKQEYKDAQPEDSGIYTCLVFYDEDDFPMEIATSNIQVVDLCADVTCDFPQKCVADYTTGTHECTCDYQCDVTDINLFCTDTCELFFNECHLREVSCLDGVERTFLNEGLCPEIVEPTVRQYRNELIMQPDYGEVIYFHSGLVRQGTPPATITWVKDGEVLEELADMEMVTVTAGPEWVGSYEARIVHCKQEALTITNSFTVLEPEVLGVHQVCSVYPGGVVERFTGEALYHDLKCTHVLAANSIVNGDYSQGWYVYGTFDEHDGNVALMHMTLFVGTAAFEFQRGWVVNVNGEKVLLEEDVSMMLGECEVMFSALHLRADCPEFSAYYDGVMTGHVVYKGTSDEAAQQGDSEFGLCWDQGSDFRVNWQVKFRPECAVDQNAGGCGDAHASCDAYTRVREDYGPAAWLSDSGVMSCGTGSSASCSELHCEGGSQSSAQQCALAQGDAVNCLLKTAGAVSERQEVEGCPDDECEWKLDLVERGCPQEFPPFRC